MSLNPFGHMQLTGVYTPNFTCAVQEVAMERIYESPHLQPPHGLMPNFGQDMPHPIPMTTASRDVETHKMSKPHKSHSKSSNKDKPHKCRFNCADNIDEELRGRMSSSYSSLNAEGRKQFLINHTQCIQLDNSKNPKGRRLAYFLTKDYRKIRVCQQFFLQTLGISKSAVDEALPAPSENTGGLNGNEKPEIPEIIRRSIQYHMECLLYVEKCSTSNTNNTPVLSSYTSVIDLYLLFLNKYKSDLPVQILPSPNIYRLVLQENYHNCFHNETTGACILCVKPITEPAKYKIFKDKERVATPSKCALKRALLMPIVETEHKCRLACMDQISHELRVQLCKNYNTMDFGERKNFILSHIRVLDVKRRRNKEPNPIRRKELSVAYYFSKQGVKARVCKSFFMKTLRISDKVVRHAINGMGPDGTFSAKDKRGGIRSTSFKKGVRTKQTVVKEKAAAAAAAVLAAEGNNMSTAPAVHSQPNPMPQQQAGPSVNYSQPCSFTNILHDGKLPFGMNHNFSIN